MNVESSQSETTAATVTVDYIVGAEQASVKVESDNPDCPNSQFSVLQVESQTEELPDFITQEITSSTQAQLSIFTEEAADIGTYVLQVTELDIANENEKVTRVKVNVKASGEQATSEGEQVEDQ